MRDVDYSGRNGSCAICDDRGVGAERLVVCGVATLQHDRHLRKVYTNSPEIVMFRRRVVGRGTEQSHIILQLGASDGLGCVKGQLDDLLAVEPVLRPPDDELPGPDNTAVLDR